MDAFAERDIVDTLRRASEQRTTLTVAHRLSSITHCDLIVVLDQGQIVEQGTHNELLRRKGGVYSQMWEAQNGEVTYFILPVHSYPNPTQPNRDRVYFNHNQLQPFPYPPLFYCNPPVHYPPTRREAHKNALA